MSSYKSIEQNPKYQELVRRRRTLSLTLSAIMMVIYFGFILVVAYLPGVLGQHLGTGVTTIGIPIGILVIVAAFILTGIYVRKANAEALINWYYDPEIAAEVAAWVNYITPVVGAKEAAVAIDPALAENQLIFPDAQTLSTVKVFRTLTGAEEQTFGAAFQSVLLGA